MNSIDAGTTASLAYLIREARSEWLADTDLSAADINSGNHPRGCCSDFVSDVYGRFGGPIIAYGLGLSEVGIDAFMTGEDGDNLRFDRDLLSRHWPNVMLPDGLTWDDMDRLAEDAGFNGGTHEWIVFESRHYDAECPDGVDNFLELPFFKRVIASWLAERAPGAAV